mgnify:CR=1 FL=1
MNQTPTSLQLSRSFHVSPERLYEWVTQADKLMQWWGPEGIDVIESALDLTRTGAYFAKMQDADGQIYHLSGQVTHVTQPRSVGFTWAWHDADDRRGPESHVTFTVQETETGARLTLSHRELTDIEAAQNHTKGWLSTLRKLDFFLNPDAALQE